MLTSEERFIVQKILNRRDKGITFFQNEPNLNNRYRSSWQRFRKLGLTPTDLRYRFLEQNELKEKRDLYRDLRELIEPFMELLSLSLETIPHVISLADSEGWIIELKGDPTPLVGIEGGLVIGSCFAEENIGNNGIGTALATEKPVFIYGVEHYGSPYKKLASFGYPLRNVEGEVIGALSISLPVKYVSSEQIGLILTTIKAVERIIICNEQIKVIKDYLTTIIHDVKNPLTIVGTISQLGEKSSHHQKEKIYFKRIREQVIEATATVNDLLMFNKPKHIKKMESPTEIIKNLLVELNPICQKNNITVNFKSNSKTPIPLERELFSRAIHNLLLNSINVMEGAGTIFIEISDIGQEVLITIKDDGPGIPEKIRENIFQPYISQRKGGTGIGLYIVYKVIKEIHNGNIWFESKTGVGTIFFIKLPKKLKEYPQ